MAAILLASIAGAPLANAGRAAMSEPAAQSQRVDMFLALLEQIYRLLGGDPSQLENIPLSEAVFVVSDYYYAHGIPTTLTAAQRAELNGAVTDLLNADKIPLLVLGPSATTTLLDMLSKMYFDLNG